MREDARQEWREIDLQGPPRMLVGWREPRRRLSALRVKLRDDVWNDLAALCQPTVDQLQNYRERPFENFAALDDGEYFWYAHSTLLRRESKDGFRDNDPTDADDTGDLVRLVKSADALTDASRDDLDEGGFTFYAICWPHRGSMIGFVSRMNPVSTLNPGFRYFQYGDAMTSVNRPDFALREGADLVIGADGTAILSPYSFDTLLGDVGVSFDNVRNDVAAVKTALAGRISLTQGAEEALLAEASRTRSNARRLRLLPVRLGTISLNASVLRKSLATHGIDAELLLDENEQFAFDPQNVGVFLDAIEGRYFEDDLGDERRRADRYSSRR